MSGHLTMSFLYIFLALAVGIKERLRISQTGIDPLTIIVTFAFIYIVMPSIVIHSIMGFYGDSVQTNIYFFDKVLFKINFFDSILIFLLTSIFIFGLYSFANQKNVNSLQTDSATIQYNKKAAAIITTVIFIVCAKFFIDLGEDFSERYSELIKFRSLDLNSNRTFFSANAFSLAQTLAWLSAAMFYISVSRRNKWLSILYFCIMMFGIFLMGSRRSIIFAVLIIYFCTIIYGKKFKFSKIIWTIPPFIVWIAFGKEILGSVVYSVDTDVVLNQYSSVPSLLLRAFCDIGITQLSSFAVMQHFDLNLRFGVDHLLSVLRRFPEGMLGFEIEWPERIVRITTENFTSADDADIAPGLIGQSWFDFPVIGAFFWGALIGFQIRLLNRWSFKYTSTPEKNALITLLCVVIALPLNTGSFDFTFSIDIIILAVALMCIFRTEKPKASVPTSKRFENCPATYF